VCVYTVTNFVNNDVSSGNIVYASDHNTQGSLLAAVLNGGIDNSNISSSAAIATSKLADDAGIGSPKLAAAVPVQIVATNLAAVSTGTTIIPYDDTIPQITEGTEVITRAITPKATTNRILIEATLLLTGSVSTDLIIALFQDATANALAATAFFSATANGQQTLTLMHDMVAGTTSSTTFRLRAGGSVAGTYTFGGSSGTRKFGGITVGCLKITEYKV
jgi:hypothetical protein